MDCLAPDVFRLHGNFLVYQFITPLLFMLPFICCFQCMLSLSFDVLKITAIVIEMWRWKNQTIASQYGHHFDLLEIRQQQIICILQFAEIWICGFHICSLYGDFLQQLLVRFFQISKLVLIHLNDLVSNTNTWSNYIWIHSLHDSYSPTDDEFFHWRFSDCVALLLRDLLTIWFPEIKDLHVFAIQSNVSWVQKPAIHIIFLNIKFFTLLLKNVLIAYIVTKYDFFSTQLFTFVRVFLEHFLAFYERFGCGIGVLALCC